MARAWCLRTPRGRLVVDTLASTREECWAEAFGAVAQALGGQWRVDHYKRWTASIRSAEKHGWRMVRVRVEEER